MKCANYTCYRELSQYEIDRISIKFSKHCFCMRCRKKMQYIELLKCRQCETMITNNRQAIYCKGCKLSRDRECAKRRYHKNIPSMKGRLLTV